MTACTPCPAAEKVTVALFGAGPGLYLDFATLRFQVPSPGAGACAMHRVGLIWGQAWPGFI